jgi:2-polyprenyl-3-methyl-5-hydroxy-6-metoxy-1,4-benzoquinol methylase
VEQTKDFYNQIYKTGGSNKEYFKEPEDSIYYLIWKDILNKLNNTEKILDLGCGVGQFAKLLIKNGKKYLFGIDFSEEAILQAKKNNIGDESAFIWADLNQINFDGSKNVYDTVLICEVLEHIENDLDILNKIHKDKRVIFSVPNYMSKGHVRCFNNFDEIINRYSKLIEFDIYKEFFIGNKGNIIYLIEGIKK